MDSLLVKRPVVAAAGLSPFGVLIAISVVGAWAGALTLMAAFLDVTHLPAVERARMIDVLRDGS